MERRGGTHELLLGVPERAKDVQDDDGGVEDGDPHGDGDLCSRVPVLDGDGGGGQLEREDDAPQRGVVVRDGGAERAVDEAHGETGEAAADGEDDRHFPERLGDAGGPERTGEVSTK